MEIDQVRAFVFAVEGGSVQAAARRLHRSQPAVSRLIQSLEASLGGALLDRSTRPASPTDFGRAVLDQARRTLEAVERLASHSRREGRSGPIRIRLGVSHAYTRMVASPHVPMLLRDGGAAALSVVTGWSLPLLRELEEAHLDGALLAFPRQWAPPAGLHGQLVRREELVVIAPRDLSLSGKVRLPDLAVHPWVLNSDGCGLRARLQSDFAAAGHPLSVGIEVVGSLSQHIDFVAAGFGLGLVPRRALSIHPLRRRVHRVRLTEVLATYLWLLWRELEPAVAPHWSRLRVALVRSATPSAL